VFVTEPDSQSVHEESLGSAEYLPAEHAVQLLASAAAPVLVIDPSWHGKQKDWPAKPWYSPTSHTAHEAMFVLA
jgi:hypothetical protein